VLASPRLRRRLRWAAVLAVAAAAAVAAIVAMPGGRERPPERLRAAPPGSQPVEQREVPLTRGTRRAIDATLAHYLPAAVGRRDPALAWSLSGPALREAAPRSKWLAGELPVYPYPFRVERRYEWRPMFTYRDRVGFDLLLQPRRGVDRGAIAVAVDMVRRGNRWQVDSWYPTAVFSSPTEKPWVTGAPDFAAGGSTADQYEAGKFERQRLDALWLLLPGALLGAGALAACIAWTVVALRRRRRATAAYGAPAGLPPLPNAARRLR
jgi:hypothetical protein